MHGAQQLGATGAQQLGSQQASAGAQQLGSQQLFFFLQKPNLGIFRFFRHENRPFFFGVQQPSWQHGAGAQQVGSQQGAGAQQVGSQHGAGAQQVGSQQGAGAQQVGSTGAQQLGSQQPLLFLQPKRPASALLETARTIMAADRKIPFIVSLLRLKGLEG